MEGDNHRGISVIDTNVCPWGGKIIYVDIDANGFNNGTCWIDAYSNLQDALGNVCNCEPEITDIWVKAGQYKPIDDVNMSGYKKYSFILADTVALMGHFAGTETNAEQRNFADANNTTTLQGQIGQSASEAVTYVVTAADINDALLDGFTVTGSYNNPDGGISLDNADVGITNCKITGNTCYGIDVKNGSEPDIYNCTFFGNGTDSLKVIGSSNSTVSYCIFNGNDRATSKGIYLNNSTIDIGNSIFKNHDGSAVGSVNSTLTVTDCNFSNSVSGCDDGISVYGSNATVEKCRITGFSSCGIEAGSSSLTVNKCIISNPSGSEGIYAEDCTDLNVHNSIITDNSDRGIYVYDSDSSDITNNWIYGNNAAIELWLYNSNHTIRNNTIVNNANFGIKNRGSARPEIKNCIIRDNSTDFHRISDINYCCVDVDPCDPCDPWGTGNILDDPCFANQAANNFHLLPESLCIDNANGNYPDETDIDGEPRQFDGDGDDVDEVDIGGDEIYLSPADYDNSEDINLIDLALFSEEWLNTNSTIDLDGNDFVNFVDFAMFGAEWMWEAAWHLDEEQMMMMGAGGFSPQTCAGGRSQFTLLPLAQSVQLTGSYSPPQPDVQELLEWLDELWQTGDLKEIMTYDEYLEFRKAVEESADY